MFSGVEHQMDLPITAEQLRRWEEGELIQNVFPDLTRGQWEFIMTGMTEDELQDYCDAMEEMYNE
tara:strand:- start:1208 stop:1402 length:195 start_codon:yes stop_codon:yes gene_type:complete